MAYEAEAVPGWKCEECGFRTDHPYNAHQKTCGPACARKRKTRLQTARRMVQEAKRRAELRAWLTKRTDKKVN